MILVYIMILEEFILSCLKIKYVEAEKKTLIVAFLGT